MNNIDINYNNHNKHIQYNKSNQFNTHNKYNKQRTLYINVDELDLYYQLFKKDIDTNRETYMKFIEDNPVIHADYIDLCKAVTDFDEKCWKESIEQQLPLRHCFISPDGHMKVYDSNNNINNMRGGSPLTAGIVIGTFVLTGIIASLIWYFLHPREECKSSYPMYPHDMIPNIGEIIEKILPGSWIRDGINSGKSLNETINETSEYLDKLTETFSVFDESVGSAATKALKSITKIGLSIGAAVLTSGMGGDKIVNIPYFIARAVNMTTKTFNKVFKVTTKITKTLQKVSIAVKKIHVKIDKHITSGETLENKRHDFINSLVNNKHQLAFIYDMFNVDFTGGPFHTICWVEYIMKYYITSEERLKEIYTMLCLMNDIYLDINESVIGFVGAALDMIIPESVGLAGTMTPLLKDYSYVLYHNVRDQITDRYQQIPDEYKILIQNPNKMSNYIFDKFSSYSWGISDIVIPSSVQQYMGKGIDVLAMGMHKGMAMTYMFLNVFIIFSELNAGINKSLINKNIDTELLLRQCVDCGNIELKGITESGGINHTDIEKCSKCKKFFVDDETASIDDVSLYNKCESYQTDRNDMKLMYSKIKKGAQITYKKLNKEVPIEEEAMEILKDNPQILRKAINDVKNEKMKDKQIQEQTEYQTEDQIGGNNYDRNKDMKMICMLPLIRKIYYDNQRSQPTLIGSYKL